MAAGWTIRPAVEADRPRLAAIFRDASLSNEGDRDDLLAHPEVLDLEPTEHLEERTRVAVADGLVVGFVTVEDGGSSGEVVDLFVDPAWMRRGIGGDLLRHEAEGAWSRGVVRLEVTANEHARSVYERAGFRAHGEEQTRFGPAVRMHLDLSRDPSRTPAPG
jgi:ribosomal protein S18 acetylase RimI-like enzyme